MLTRGGTVVDACMASQSKRGNVFLWKRSTSKHLLEQWQRRRFAKWKQISQPCLYHHGCKRHLTSVDIFFLEAKARNILRNSPRSLRVGGLTIRNWIPIFHFSMTSGRNISMWAFLSHCMAMKAVVDTRGLSWYFRTSPWSQTLMGESIWKGLGVSNKLFDFTSKNFLGWNLFPHNFLKQSNFLIFPSTPGRTTYCNRLLYAVLPSSMYAKKDKSIDALVTALVRDFNQLYWDGFDVPCPIGQLILLPQKAIRLVFGEFTYWSSIYLNQNLALYFYSPPDRSHALRWTSVEMLWSWGLFSVGWRVTGPFSGRSISWKLASKPEFLGSVIIALALNLW